MNETTMDTTPTYEALVRELRDLEWRQHDAFKEWQNADYPAELGHEVNDLALQCYEVQRRIRRLGYDAPDVTTLG
jgi:hypothetical protein